MREPENLPLPAKQRGRRETDVDLLGDGRVIAGALQIQGPSAPVVHDAKVVRGAPERGLIPLPSQRDPLDAGCSRAPILDDLRRAGSREGVAHVQESGRREREDGSAGELGARHLSITPARVGDWRSANTLSRFEACARRHHQDLHHNNLADAEATQCLCQRAGVAIGSAVESHLQAMLGSPCAELNAEGCSG